MRISLCNSTLLEKYIIIYLKSIGFSRDIVIHILLTTVTPMETLQNWKIMNKKF